VTLLHHLRSLPSGGVARFVVVCITGKYCNIMLSFPVHALQCSLPALQHSLPACRETESLGCMHSFSNFLQRPSFFLYVGTKLHQQTCKAIAKHQPALMSAICKFNSYCERLAELYDMSSGIPLPSPLPTKLAELRNDQTVTV